MAKTEYFYDGPRFVASLDDGSLGFFICHASGGDAPAWRFIVPGSIAWDEIHQDIYFAHHDLDPCPPALIASLPPIPPPPPFKWMAWKDNFALAGPLLAKDCPRLRERLDSAAGRSERFWFLLEEDRYETCLGDGEFHYFHGIVFDAEEAARAFAEARNVEEERSEREDHQYGTLYTVKSFELGLAGNELFPIGWEPESYQDYRIEKVVARIEATLASEGRLSWGTREPG